MCACGACFGALSMYWGPLVLLCTTNSQFLWEYRVFWCFAQAIFGGCECK
jgi:hypothetical protein